MRRLITSSAAQLRQWTQQTYRFRFPLLIALAILLCLAPFVSQAARGKKALPGSVAGVNPATTPSGMTSVNAPALPQERQASPDGLWQEADSSSLRTLRAERQLLPSSSRTRRLNQEALTRLLSQAPLEFTPAAREKQVVMTVPMPDGTFARFRIEQSPIMAPELAAKFPEIKTYQGWGLDEPTAFMRFDRTPAGLHAIVLSERGIIYVNPYAQGETGHYVSYYQRDDPQEQRPFACQAQQENAVAAPAAAAPRPRISLGDTLRTYRLAAAATGQFTAQNGGTVASAMAVITGDVNKVNAVYQTD